MAPFLGNLLADPYAAVRFVAYRSLRGLPRYQSLDYDFVGSADTWPEAVKRVSEIWEEQLQERAVFSRELLMTPNGRLDGAIFERLKKMRDDTPIHLAE